MGYYINEDSKGNLLPSKGKAEMLLNDGAEFTDATYKENLICVVDHGFHEAAGYMFSEGEFEYFKEIGASKQWLVHPKAKELAK
jgi:hypothetical protein